MPTSITGTDGVLPCAYFTLTEDRDTVVCDAFFPPCAEFFSSGDPRTRILQDKGAAAPYVSASPDAALDMYTFLEENCHTKRYGRTLGKEANYAST
jgi:hypothetical protein